jgi:glutathione synthetase
MGHISPDGPVYQAGTLSGNPIAMCAGLATIRKILNEKAHGVLKEKGMLFASLLKKHVDRYAGELLYARIESIFAFYFTQAGKVRSLDDVKAFRAEHKDIIVKPLYGNGGAAVFRLQPGDTNLGSLVELFQTVFREPFMVQQYRPEVRNGDKRIILVDGEVAGAINRVPSEGETRSNLHVGGTAKPTELTPREREICDRLAPELKKRGLIFTGIDVIGDYLTEINVTSPTGIRQVKAFGGNDIAAMIWDAIEKQRAAR